MESRQSKEEQRIGNDGGGFSAFCMYAERMEVILFSEFGKKTTTFFL